MKHSDFVVAKSGTTTLETSLFATPFIIVYKANPLTVAIAKKISRVKYIGLPNLIANDMIVKELIQEDMTAENIKNEIENILSNDQRKQEFKQILKRIKSLLGDKSASKNCAKKIKEIIYE
jgi:lipid-A-disaccharide synthase